MDSKFRASLRSQGQVLEPYVMVGREGMTEGVIAALSEALFCHELVKVRFQDHKEETRAIASQMALATDSSLVGTVGFTALFYKKNPDKKN